MARSAAAPRRRQARPRSLRRLKAQLLRGGRESQFALLLRHRGYGLSRSTGVGDLAGRAQFLSEIRPLHDGAYVGSDTLAKLRRHALWSQKKPTSPSSVSSGCTSLTVSTSGQVGLAVGRRKHLDFPTSYWTRRRQRCFGHLDTSRGNVVGCVLRVAIGHRAMSRLFLS